MELSLKTFTKAIDDAFSSVADPVVELGKSLGVSNLTDPLKDFARDAVSNEVGMFIARVWATHAANWFRSPAAFALFGPAAPALGILAMAAPSFAKGETQFSRAYAQQAIWSINTGLKILSLKGVELPAAEMGQVAELNAQIIKDGAARLREMKSYGVDLESIGRVELARIVGTDRIDLALLAKAAVTESLGDVTEAAHETAALAHEAAAAIDQGAQMQAQQERAAARAQAVARGQSIVERADRVTEGQRLIDAAGGGLELAQLERSGAPRNRTAENLMLAAVIAAAVGALVWWQRGQRSHG